MTRQRHEPGAGLQANAPQFMREKPDVLVFTGAGRSGTTILEMLLTTRYWVVAVGELCWLWKSGVSERSICTCSRPVPDCQFWGPCW
jgi:hypothetical protein